MISLLKLTKWKLFLLISPVMVILAALIPITPYILLDVLAYSEFPFLIAWYYQIGISFQKTNSNNNRTKLKLAFLIVSCFYILSIGIQSYHEYISKNATVWFHSANFLTVLFFILAGILFVLPSFIYMMYINVNTLLSLKNPTWPYNALQTTLLLLYAPIFGVFLVQPKLNAYIKKISESTLSNFKSESPINPDL